MGKFLARILIAIIVINWFQILVWATDSGVEELRTLPFRRQLVESNKLYLEMKIYKILEELDTINEKISSAKTEPLVSWLNEGDGKENDIIKTVEELIGFKKSHNERIDTWTRGDSLPVQFLAPFKMNEELVKRIKQKNYPTPWRYIAICWYPHAINLRLHDDPIPKDALELTPAMWNLDDTDVQRYAFFSLYRKTRHDEKFSVDFLDIETGYRSFWFVEKKKKEIHHWKYLYYTYEYIEPNKIPDVESHSLKSFILNNTRWKGVETLDEFYNVKKLKLYHDVLDEMSKAVLKRERIDSYWGLYTFVCQTFPCISAFKITKGKGTGYRFVDGYADDKPAQRKFNPKSVVGYALCLLNNNEQLIVSGNFYRKILYPILLLQLEIPDTASLVGEGFPYVDIKVGFKGFLDFYNEIVSDLDSKAQGVKLQR
ncbi:MAG TPA: hypothetical protein ACFYD6_11370 [Candidatus Brocadiia bacterium]|nr:hypothetical protein [Candidatus Brocadiales bacterium]